MKKIVNKLIFLLNIFSALYLIGCFTALDFNPSNWLLFTKDTAERTIKGIEAARFGVASIVFIVILGILFKDEMEDLIDDY